MFFDDKKEVFLINKLRLDLYSKWKHLPSILGMGKYGAKLTEEQKKQTLIRWGYEKYVGKD